MAKQTVTVSVLADSKPLRKEFSNLGNKLGLGKLGKLMRGLGKSAAVGLAAGAAAAVVLGKTLVDAGERASTSNARIRAIADSMGLFGAEAGTVTDRLVKLSETTARATGIDQNSIKATQAKLLTFKELAGSADEVGGNFDRATQAAIDLEAAGFGPAEQSAVQLGKALNDPIKGITALNRQGITFTQVEQDKIAALVESGKQHEAQDMILSALEKQVGGTATATANATDRMKVAFSQVTERLGQKLMPILDKVATWVVDKALPALEDFAKTAADYLGPKLEALGRFLNDEVLPRLRELRDYLTNEVVPKLQELAGQVADKLVPALQDLGSYLTDTVVPKLQELGQWVQDNRAWLEPLAVAVLAMVAAYKLWTIGLAAWQVITTAATAVQAAFNVVLAANPIGLVVLAIVGLIAALVYLWNTNDGFREAVTKAWEAIKGAIGAVWDWITETALPAIGNGISSAIGFIVSLPGRAKSALAGMLSTLWDRGKQLVQGLINGITNTFGSFTSKVGEAPGKAKAALSSAATTLKTRGTEFMRGLIDGIKSRFTSMVTWVKSIPGRVTRALSGAGTLLLETGKDLIRGLVDGLWSMASWLGDQIGSLVSRWVPGPVKKILGISSPSRLFASFGRNTMQGLAQGLRQAAPEVGRTMTGITRKLAGTPLQLRGQLELEGKLAATAAGSSSSSSSPLPQRVYEVTVQALAPSPEIGRAVVEAIRDFERHNGVTVR